MSIDENPDHYVRSSPIRPGKKNWRGLWTVLYDKLAMICKWITDFILFSPVHTLKIACDIPFLTNCQQFITKIKVLTRIGNNLNET